MNFPTKLTDVLLELPERDRLELARILVESVGSTEKATTSIDEAVRRLEDLAIGKAKPLSEAEFRREVSR